jgi:hypothetical protein
MGNGTTGQVTVNAGQQGTIGLVLGNPNFCQIPTGLLFASASSFISPVVAHKRIYQAVIDRHNVSGNLLLVIGHTDDVGQSTSNVALSQRRARAAIAVLTGNTAEWETTFRDPNERWSDADFQSMLAEVGLPSDPQSIRQHRELSAAGQLRRATLFAGYFQSLRGGLAPLAPLNSFTPPFLGCGEQHALGSGDHAPSRRVEFFFFLSSARGSSPILPAIDCSQYSSLHNPCALIPITPPAVTDFFVSELGDNPGGTGSRTNPWQTILHSFTQIAILRQPGQHITLNVLAGSYAENVVIPNNTTLLAFGGAVPEIQGQGGREPAVRINNVINSGISGLRITSGDLSGVRITSSRDITVTDCVISENFAPRGGGVSIIDSNQVTIENNTIELNTAGTIDTAVVSVDIDAAITSQELEVFEMQVGDAHGGGLYVENSGQIFVRNNTIRNNQAILFGGGVAVDNRPDFAGAVEISGNQIVCNQCAHADLSSLSVPATDCVLPDMKDPLVDRMESETIDEVAARAANLLHGVGIESGIGGGIALRHVTPDTVLSRNTIGREGQPNRARRGGGIECFVGAYPTLRDNTITFNLSSDDGGGISIDQFDPFLPVSQPTFFGFRRGAIFPRRTIEMENNSIEFNRCRSDGGGIYATGNPRIAISGRTNIQGNQAGENGGGIRVSYSARLNVTGATISGNRCHTLSTEKDGGGGIAARNAEVTLRNCSLSNNVSPGFAGGAAFFTSAFEGGFGPGGFIGNEFGQFDQMMRDDFQFGTRRYHFHDCRGNDNQALGDSGAGGFVYAVRVFGNEVMEVSIRGAGTGILTNTSTFDRNGNRQKRGNVVIDIPLAQPVGQPGDRFFITADVPPIVAGGIATSSPPPDDNPVVVILAAGAVRPTTFPFSFGPAPRIVDLDPRFGPPAGGQPITITGQRFMQEVVVTIGGAPATVTSVTDSSISATTPPGTLGQADIVVTNPDAQTDSVRLGYEYVPPPTVIDVQPRTGPPSGGTPITITGTGFQSGVRVLIDGRVADNITLISSTTITAEIPNAPGVSGTVPVDVEVRNVDNQSERITRGFTYVTSTPVILNLQPRSGPSTVPIPITVDGTDFLAGVQLSIGGQPATILAVSSTRILAQTPIQPNAAGLVDIEIRNPDGGSDVAASGFEYIPPPRISDVQPRSGGTGGGTPITITGSGFLSGVTVFLGGLPAPNTTLNSSTQITAQTPPHSAGNVDIDVRNADGQRDSVPLGFAYQ